jgi:hypothetical protein
LDILKHYQILIVNPNVERNNGEDLDDWSLTTDYLDYWLTGLFN